MNEHSLIYMTKLYDEAMELNTKLQEELENLKNTNEEHRVLNGKLREENKRLNNIINKVILDIEDTREKNNYYEDYKVDNSILTYWIDILKGSDKE